MSVLINPSSDTDSTVKVLDGDAVTRESYTRISNSDGTSGYRAVYRGAEDLMNDYYEEIAQDAYNLSSITLDVAKGAGFATVDYNSDLGQNPDEEGTEEPPATVPDESAAEWNVDIIEVMRPLASHPYFQRPYFPASGYTIERELAKADLAVGTGEEYTPDLYYGEYVSKYYALRVAGVVQYPALGVEVRKVYTTTDNITISSAYSKIGFAVDLTQDIAPPIPVLTGLEQLKKITGYTSSDPDSYTLANDTWEFIKRPTRMVMSGNANSNQTKLEETWWGIDRWSKVLYPTAQGSPANRSTWNPPQA